MLFDFIDLYFCVLLFFQRWYAFSKTLAEDAARKFLNEHDIELVVINPGMSIGPLLQPELNGSSASILNLINGKFYLLIKSNALQVFFIITISSST